MGIHKKADYNKIPLVISERANKQPTTLVVLSCISLFTDGKRQVTNIYKVERLKLSKKLKEWLREWIGGDFCLKLHGSANKSKSICKLIVKCLWNIQEVISNTIQFKIMKIKPQHEKVIKALSGGNNLKYLPRLKNISQNISQIYMQTNTEYNLRK